MNHKKEFKIVLLLTKRFHFNGFWHVQITNNGEKKDKSGKWSGFCYYVVQKCTKNVISHHIFLLYMTLVFSSMDASRCGQFKPLPFRIKKISNEWEAKIFPFCTSSKISFHTCLQIPFTHKKIFWSKFIY